MKHVDIPSRLPLRAALLSILLLALCIPALSAEPAQSPIPIKVTKMDEKVVVDAHFTIAASPQEVWNVFTDYDHMAAFLPNFEISKVMSREGNRLQVTQKGKQSFGLFSFGFDNLREVNLKPFTDIESRLIHGTTLRQSDGSTRFVDKGDTTEVIYHGEFIPNISFPAALGMNTVETETRKQFEQIRGEVERRKSKPQ